MSKQKNKSDFKAKSMYVGTRSAYSGNSRLSSKNGFISIGTKTGVVGKFFFFRWHLAKATTSL